MQQTAPPASAFLNTASSPTTTQAGSATPITAPAGNAPATTPNGAPQAPAVGSGFTAPSTYAPATTPNGAPQAPPVTAPPVDTGGFNSSSSGFLQSQADVVAQNQAAATAAAQAQQAATDAANQSTLDQSNENIQESQDQSNSDRSSATDTLAVNQGRFAPGITNDTASAQYAAAIGAKFDTVNAHLAAAKNIAAGVKTAADAQAAATELAAELKSASDEQSSLMDIYKQQQSDSQNAASLAISQQNANTSAANAAVNLQQFQQSAHQFALDNGINQPYYSVDGGQSIIDANTGHSVDQATFLSMGGNSSLVQNVVGAPKYASGAIGEYTLYSQQVSAKGGTPMDFLSYQKTLANAGRSVTVNNPNSTSAIDNVEAAINAHPGDYTGAYNAANSVTGGQAAIYDNLIKAGTQLPGVVQGFAASLQSKLANGGTYSEADYFSDAQAIQKDNSYATLAQVEAQMAQAGLKDPGPPSAADQENQAFENYVSGGNTNSGGTGQSTANPQK